MLKEDLNQMQLLIHGAQCVDRQNPKLLKKLNIILVKTFEIKRAEKRRWNCEARILLPRGPGKG